MSINSRGRSAAAQAVGLALLAGLLAGPCAAQDPAMSMDLPLAVDLALTQNFGILRARNALASSQSSLIVAENRFDFQLRTTLRDDRNYSRNVTITDPVGGDLSRDVFDDGQDLRLDLAKEMQWGGSFGVDASLRRDRSHFSALDPRHSASYGVSYRQPLWRGRGRKVATRSLIGSRLAYLDQTRVLTEAELSLVVSVTSDYHDIQRLQALIDISRQAADRSADRLALSRLRLAEGFITPIDVKRAERDLHDRENDVIASVESHEAALDEFAFQLGLPLGTLMSLSPVRERFEPLEIDTDAAVALALANRFDLAGERESLELAELDVEIARSNSRPTFDLTLRADFGTEIGEEVKEFFDLNNEDDWGSSLVFAYTFNDRADNERVLQSRIALENRKLSLIESERRVALEVRGAVRRIRSLERRIEILAQNKELAREALALAGLQFEEDLISTTDLLQDQDEVVDAERRYVEAITDHAITRVNLDLTLGRYGDLGRIDRSEWLRESPPPPDLPLSRPLASEVQATGGGR